MLIEFTPRITGQDVRTIMDQPEVDDELALLGISKKKAHDLVKTIMIASFKGGVWNINNIINDTKRK